MRAYTGRGSAPVGLVLLQSCARLGFLAGTGFWLVVWSAEALSVAAAGPVVRITQVDVSHLPTVEVEVVVTSPDADGAGCLGPEQFSLRDDGAPVSARLSQHSAADIGAVIVLVDRSGSMRGERMRQAIAAAQRLVSRLPSNYLLGLTTCGGARRWQLRPSEDRFTLRKKLESVSAGGRNELGAGMARALALLPPAASRKAVVLISDGRVGGESLVARCAQAASAAGAAVHAIGVGAESGDRWLRALAEAAGGRFTASPTADEMTALCRAIAPDASGRYGLSYRTGARDHPSWHDLEVVVRTQGASGAAQARFFSRPSEEVSPPDAPGPLGAVAIGAIALALLIANVLVRGWRKRQ